MNTLCGCAFEDFVVQCNDVLVVNAYLEPDTAYIWVIRDKFGNNHSGAVTSDADGHVEIPVADMPEGLLTQFSGAFTLQFFLDTDLCTPVLFKMAKTYDAVEFEVRPGTFTKNSLGCAVL